MTRPGQPSASMDNDPGERRPASELDPILTKWRNKDWTELESLQRATHVSSSPIVVVGACARSGTTLLRVMLDSHSKIFCGPESNIFIPRPLDLGALAFRYDIPRSSLEIMLRDSKDRAEFIDRFRAANLTRSGKSLWAEKTPRNIHMFEWILRHFPAAKLIHVLRDGRDVVCSLRTHRKRRVVDGKVELTGYRFPLEECTSRWLRAVKDGIRLRGNANYLEVRYEDLVLNSEPTITSLCDKIGVRFEPAMLTFHEFTGPTRDPLKFPQNIEATEPLYTSAVGRWKRDLATADERFVVSKIGTLLAEVGYLL
jgi:protein-tyrosine sulfotransferase